jgi:hypothetical protein
MLVYKDRVGQATTTTGTGTYSLGSALTNFQAFDVIGDGNACHYVAKNNFDWEVGIGTVTVGSPSTLARTAILASSNSGSAVDWVAGTKTLFLTAPAAFFGLLFLGITGTPEGVVTAPVGALATRADGGAGTTLYVKESGTGDTGWVAK